MSALSPGDELTARVASLAQGGEGVAREEGRPVVFVGDTAPGDLVRLAIRDVERSHCRADLLEVLEPGPARRAPPCPEAGRCGGCDWLHLTEDAQAEAAKELLRSALVRTGKLTLPEGCVTAAARPGAALRYRQRARFQLDLGAAPPRMGFHQRRSHDVLVPAECFVLEPELEAFRRGFESALPRLAEILRSVRTAEIQVDVPAQGKGIAQLVLDGDAARERASLERAAALVLAAPAIEGVEVVARGRGGRVAMRVRAGAEHVAYRRGSAEEPQRFPARHSPGGFLQPSRAGSEALVSRVLAASRAFLRDGARALELFAGTGNFTLPLAAEGANVTAVESDARSVEDARAAASEAGLAAHIELLAGDAARRARDLVRAGRRFDLVVLDPPRTGARDVVPLLADTGARGVVYVSCDAVTLARDAAALAARGFALQSAEPLLLFPQTAHFETVAVFRREP